MRTLLKDSYAKNDTDEALRVSDDYDHQEMCQLSEAAKAAAAKAKHIEGASTPTPRRGWRRRSRGPALQPFSTGSPSQPARPPAEAARADVEGYGD